MEHGVAVGNLGFGAVSDTGDQNIGLCLQLLQGRVAEFGVNIHPEFQCFDLPIRDGVDGQRSAGLVLHSTDVAENIVAAQLFGADDTA